MERKNIVIVGLNPSKVSGTKQGPALRRLYSWAEQINLPIFSFMNLSDDPEWDFKYKSIDKKMIVQMLSDRDIIVALGSQVYNTLKRLGFNSFKMPHPSPLNRQLNDSEYEKQMLSELKDYVERCN